jgi:hypothetical protein
MPKENAKQTPRSKSKPTTINTASMSTPSQPNINDILLDAQAGQPDVEDTDVISPAKRRRTYTLPSAQFSALLQTCSKPQGVIDTLLAGSPTSSPTTVPSTRPTLPSYYTIAKYEKKIMLRHQANL